MKTIGHLITTFLIISKARSVISARLPIGVAMIYKVPKSLIRPKPNINLKKIN